TRADAVIWAEVKLNDGRAVPNNTVSVGVFDDRGFGTGASVVNGTFTVTVPPRTYRILVVSNDPSLSPPRIDPVTVVAGDETRVPNIVMLRRTARVVGRLTIGTDVAASGVPVDAIQSAEFGGGFASTTSRSDGTFELTVSGPDPASGLPTARWLVRPRPAEATGLVFSGLGRVIDIANDGSATANFELATVPATIEGTVRLGNRVLTDLSAGVLACVANTAGTDCQPNQPVGSGAVENGRFSVRVQPGTYLLSLLLPPGSRFLMTGTIAGTRFVTPTVTVAAAGTARPTILVVERENRVTGRIQLVGATLATTETLEALVTASDGRGGLAQVRTDTRGNYTFTLNPGTWQLDARPLADAQGRVRFILVPGTYSVTVVGALTAVPAASSPSFERAGVTIVGRVLDADGGAVSGAWVYAQQSAGDVFVFAAGVNSDGRGFYTMTVRADLAYRISAATGLARVRGQVPDVLSITAAQAVANTTLTNRNIQFQRGTFILSGSITREGGGAVGGVVRAFSAAGGSLSAQTTAGGLYSLTVSSGDWVVEAIAELTPFTGATTRTVWSSLVPGTTTLGETLLTISANTSQDFTLRDTGRPVPPGRVLVLDATRTQVVTLEDASEIIIPAGALPIAASCRDVGNRNVTLSITPRSDLPKQTGLRMVGFGYDMIARDCVGPITQKFTQPVSLRFRTTVSGSAQSIAPALFSSNSNAWQVLGTSADETYVIGNFVLSGGTAPLNDSDYRVADITSLHFTEFAILATGGAAASAPVVAAAPVTAAPVAAAPSVGVGAAPGGTVGGGFGAAPSVGLVGAPAGVPVVETLVIPGAVVGVPTVNPALGGTLVSVPAQPGAVAVVNTPPAYPLPATVIAPARDVPVFVRLQPEPLAALPQPLAQGVVPVAVLSVDVIRGDTRQVLREHPQPLTIVARVVPAVLAAAQGNPALLAIVRFDPARNQYMRLPTRYVVQDGVPLLAAETTRTSAFAVVALPQRLAATPVDEPTP
ncbi:MAG: hypothetical protein HYU88_11295, partial [Chloroflexi bacterium]|nr:hypothetical protein [Chloroflexota bacterium]